MSNDNDEKKVPNEEGEQGVVAEEEEDEGMNWINNEKCHNFTM